MLSEFCAIIFLREYIAVAPRRKGYHTMLDFEKQLLEMIRSSKNPEVATEIAVKVILDFLTLPRSSG